MPSVGYSGKPLLQKLGIRENMRLHLLNPPYDYMVLLEKDVSQQLCKKKEVPDFIHLFAADNKSFETAMLAAEPSWKKNTAIIIWVSWYKKSAGMDSDLTEDIIRRYALAHGLVDVKVCAVSGLWSGLKLVVPLKNRRH